MKILYGVQGTGHGHISRARVILPRLREIAQVDVLISGYNFKLHLDGEITYKARGISLAYDRKGSVDVLETALNIQPVKLLQDIQSLPIEDYDFVVNDYEPVTAWAAQTAGLSCVAISHQASFLSEKTPRPKKKSLVAEGILRHFAPSNSAVACHYLRYDYFIEPPIVRKQIQRLSPFRQDHVTVYLPAFNASELLPYFKQVREVKWHFFTADCEQDYWDENVWIRPVGNESFLESIESCEGIVSATGFETTSESMYLRKKLLTIPIKNQYEQLCNAAAIEQLGGKVVYDIGPEFVFQLRQWLQSGIHLDLPEVCDEKSLIQKIIQQGTSNTKPRNELFKRHAILG